MTTTHYPRAHTNDPQASHDAAAALDENAVSALKQAILTLLATPMTAHELTSAYDRAREGMGWPALADPHNIARRVSELHSAGRIVDTGVKGPGRYRPATVWAVAA
ncbi:hypothetical protein D9V30_10380 [Mycetocola reblochoni]|uniref:Uncharacterized protein n=2 Tax=Mycetocola reblochoni TaxID=331618 RepID=A0A1R4JPG7_9MICO|nr:hypothetical protein [Mycetocola reblochoni]RLP68387.1 hypothetical protein D9V30_10380 [Mycetocola reblochoni]SJN33896.1 hypothetical protein FM119_08635 [Mycetocola reblochoni REB411]